MAVVEGLLFPSHGGCHGCCDPVLLNEQSRLLVHALSHLVSQEALSVEVL